MLREASPRSQAGYSGRGHFTSRATFIERYTGTHLAVATDLGDGSPALSLSACRRGPGSPELHNASFSDGDSTASGQPHSPPPAILIYFIGEPARRCRARCAASPCPAATGGTPRAPRSPPCP